MHIYRLAVAGIQKLIIEALEVIIDESVVNLQLEIEITSDGNIRFNEYSISLMLLHKRSNPAELLTTFKNAINRLDYRHRITGLSPEHTSIISSTKRIETSNIFAYTKTTSLSHISRYSTTCSRKRQVYSSPES